MNKKDYLVVIPARLNSTRIKNKPLIELNGLPLIIHVCKRVAHFVDKEKILIATEDVAVKNLCEKFGYVAVLTSNDHQHPLDRVSEVAFKIRPSAAYLVINGDEPFFFR